MKGILVIELDEELLPKARFENKPDNPHVTLLYGAQRWQHSHSIGRSVNIWLYSEAWNSEIQAYRVQLPRYLEIFCQNKVPHVTRSWKTGSRSGEASALFWDVQRDEIFEEDGFEPFSVTGQIGFIPFK